MIFIHHGTGVEAYLSELLETKKLVVPEYKNLNVASVKDLVSNYSKVWPVRDGVIVAGALDQVRSTEILDILLKSIEDPIPNAPELILWAYDLGSVPKTIRSRCGEKYHYQYETQNVHYKDAERLLKALKDKDILSLTLILKNVPKSDVGAFINGFMEVLLDHNLVGFYEDNLRDIVKTNSKAHMFSYFLERV